jgi:hypothetical protein
LPGFARCIAVVVGLLVAQVATLCAAQTAGERPGGNPGDRVLEGHAFIPSQLVRDPFAATFVAVDVGAGKGSSSVRVPRLNRDLDLSQAAVTNSFAFQLGITPWWALRIGGETLVFTGDNARTAIVVGQTWFYRAEAGTTFKIPLARRLALGLTFDYGWGTDYTLIPVNVVVRGRPVLRITDANILRPGSALAIALNAAIGLVLRVDYEHRTNVQVIEGTDFLLAGLSIDVDFRATSHIPLGLVVAYQGSVALAGAEADRGPQRLQGGLFYTGRANLVVGPELELGWEQQLNGFNTTVIRALIALRYYF